MSRASSELDIAVVIVTYKCATLTLQSLASIVPERSIAGMRIRVVVVDNASGDTNELAEVIETNDWSSWVTLVTAPRNGGFAYGNNVGIRRAYDTGTPAYVYLLNPDAQIRSGAIASLARFLEAHPDVGIAGGSFETLDGSDWPFAFRFPGLMSELLQGIGIGALMRLFDRWVVARPMKRVAQPTDWISGASMMIRPSVLASIGGLDENYFLYFEETDLCYRAKQAGFHAVDFHHNVGKRADKLLLLGKSFAEFLHGAASGLQEHLLGIGNDSRFIGKNAFGCFLKGWSGENFIG